MDLVQRAKNIIVSPRAEWHVIASETTSTGELIASYALPLIVIDAIAGFVSAAIIGTAAVMFGAPVALPVTLALVGACVHVVTAVVGVFVLSIIINALAPTFGGQPSNIQALKLAVYSYTAAWVAAIATVVPILGGLIAFVGAIYSLYLLYLGLPVLMKNPADKSVIYTIVIVVSAIVLAAVLAVVAGMFMGASMLGARFMI